MSLHKTITVLDVGMQSFKSVWQIQQFLVSKHLECLTRNATSSSTTPFSNFLVLCEHNPVYTIGIRTKDYSEEEEKKLKGLGAEFERTNRGGLITFHGPGQLVAYPVINLKLFDGGVRWYVCNLEKTLIHACRGLGLHAETTADTGVWIGDNKIAAVGISCRRHITSHGISLNCNNDLSWFDHIVPCGIEGKGVTSLSRELDRDFSTREAAGVFLESFSKQFGCSFSYPSSKELDDIMSYIL